jgi:hypothetical protein
MKSLTFYSLLLAGAAQAGLIPPQVDAKNVDWKYLQKRQILGTLTWMIGMITSLPLT